MGSVTVSAQELAVAVERRLKLFAEADAVARIWRKDATVWSSDPSRPELADRLGWLRAAEWMQGQLGRVEELAAEVRGSFDRVVLLGMGGSSLAPEVLWRSFGRQAGWPGFEMLDSTHPAAIAAVGERGDLDRTLFIVSSKSGTTVETVCLFRYFWEKCSGVGQQFAAITDRGTPLERLARDNGFRDVFLNPSDIGGRFSALSMVGVLPAVLMGVNGRRLLARAHEMADRCRTAEGELNPGVALGVALGEAALGGRDKLTLVLSPALSALGLWLEQLVAESTGKDGRGIIPLANEDFGERPGTADDRLFVTVTLAGTRSSGTQVQLRDVERAGHPVIRLELDDRYALGGEFFRWEFATAVAGAILGVNPFDQPNVAESKRNSERVLVEGTVADQGFASGRELAEFLAAVSPGDYVAIAAYLPPSSRIDRKLLGLQTKLRERARVAVSVGYGPRLLHSTGQLHKGGPPKGHFLQVLDRSGADIPVPGEGYTFGDLIAAQALGDFEALSARGRPVLRFSSLASFERALASV